MSLFICTKCGILYGPMYRPNGECGNCSKPTNADRIRSMSDDELKEFLNNWNCDEHIVLGGNHR